MPEQQPAPVAPVGGYPPMPMLHWAAPGWPRNGALTPLDSPDAARLTLRAESGTFVLDPVGMCRLRWRDAHVLLVLVVVLLMIAVTVQYLRGDEHLPFWWLIVMPLVTVFNGSGRSVELFITRAVPPAGVVPRWGRARWRWYRNIRREPVPAPSPPAAWPPGSEAYALLCGAASVESVAQSWLCERVGMSHTVGAEWVTVLARQGWLTGGGRVLGMARLPEVHVMATDAGRQRLAQERACLERLARS